jgi:hypothetical protein
MHENANLHKNAIFAEEDDEEEYDDNGWMMMMIGNCNFIKHFFALSFRNR